MELFELRLRDRKLEAPVIPADGADRNSLFLAFYEAPKIQFRAGKRIAVRIEHPTPNSDNIFGIRMRWNGGCLRSFLDRPFGGRWLFRLLSGWCWFSTCSAGTHRLSEPEADYRCR